MGNIVVVRFFFCWVYDKVFVVNCLLYALEDSLSISPHSFGPIFYHFPIVPLIS